MTSAKTTKVRFAPSPTGYLHVGNARVALVNWLFAKRDGGRFLLRIDDTDRARSKPEYDEAIREDMAWLGLAWDELVRQSDRDARYHAATEALKAAGRLYACYETPDELDAMRKLRLAHKLPPVYDRAALKLTDADRAKLESEGRKPHWRFLLNDGKVNWTDLVHGAAGFETKHLSDPVLVREDGALLYTLTSVVDDIDTAITQVIRGDDHMTNTAVQIQLFEALGAAAPQFAHLPLMTGAKGEGLSKREGALSLRDLRAEGVEPMAVCALLAALGTSDAVAPHASLNDLVAGFDWSKFGRASPKFDKADLDRLNAQYVHGMSFAEAKAHAGVEMDEAFWLAVRGNLTKASDAAEWWSVCREPLAPIAMAENGDFLKAAADALPDVIDSETWPAWTKALAAATDRKGKALFQPLRLALTGREHGPEMKNLLPLIGPARAKARLLGKTA
ncbi:MAG TPA: glutamate--tRNA ligase [Alphaproteobacteria bacterium]